MTLNFPFSPSFSCRLLAPIQLLTRAATAHPELAVRINNRLASLQPPDGQTRHRATRQLGDLPEGTHSFFSELARRSNEFVQPPAIGTPLRPEWGAPLSPGSNNSSSPSQYSHQSLNPSNESPIRTQQERSPSKEEERAIAAEMPFSVAAVAGFTAGEDQFKFLDDIQIEFEEDDLPF